jgi:hypothetical protein
MDNTPAPIAVAGLDDVVLPDGSTRVSVSAAEQDGVARLCISPAGQSDWFVDVTVRVGDVLHFGGAGTWRVLAIDPAPPISAATGDVPQVRVVLDPRPRPYRRPSPDLN